MDDPAMNVPAKDDPAMNSLVNELQGSQRALEPRFKALRETTAALKGALKLASESKADALPMQRALHKLQTARERLEGAGLADAQFAAATERFRAATDRALDALSFDFARELRASFEERGLAVAGRPPTLVVGEFVLTIDIAARKAQWFYGKEAVSKPLPLSQGAILKAYEGQKRDLLERGGDPVVFLAELHASWQSELSSRGRRPAQGRVNLVELYSKLTLSRQSARFWNAPSKSTFRDYPRAHFVRDLVLAREALAQGGLDGQPHRPRLGVATKSQADQASRSMWLPRSPLEGEYYSDLTFEEG